MTKPTQSIFSLWTSLSSIIPTEPYVWTITNNFKPWLAHLGIHPTAAWKAAVLWAFLDATFVPVLIFLDPIIEPLLALGPKAKGQLHTGVCA